MQQGNLFKKNAGPETSTKAKRVTTYESGRLLAEGKLEKAVEKAFDEALTPLLEIYRTSGAADYRNALAGFLSRFRDSIGKDAIDIASILTLDPAASTAYYKSSARSQALHRKVKSMPLKKQKDWAHHAHILKNGGK